MLAAVRLHQVGYVVLAAHIKTYTTDPTGIANNENSYTMHANADKMQNDRVLGNILLTKVDLDAARYLAAGSNGDTTLEGAVYDLYAAENITHPDGVTGIVDYSKITDVNGQPIWHTTVLTNGGWDTDYLPILQKDRLVASAKITDGKLAFANLYMGRYYLVERATGLVLPIDGNGKLYVTGKYPLLNKKLERTGKYSSLATKGGEYTDYIYKNQYSAVAESRKLDGSKAWDGYYLSHAKGYLCDEVNHYKTLSYADESTYHIHAEQESQDEVLKSGFSLQKLVSTTGQPSPALKLEGAGFTVYRISKLSKAAQFKQNPDGSYDAASILSAYRKDNYDNATLKYDFSAEGQAIANMYESSNETVNAYNATLTADGDYANGKGNGWMPTDQPAEYRLGEMFTNDEGIFRVEGLPYGQYLVVETTIPKDVFQCDPFIVTVDANSPQSRFTIPAGSVTTASNDYMTYNILDEELEGYLQLMAQLKAMYKDDWESLVGLCDEFLYLGGTEKETHKYVSELLGKETISTTSYNQSKGRSGSYSINHQQSGRDLMTPDEVRLLDNSKCILFIRGERPVIDLKYNLLKHPNIRYTDDGSAAPYDYTAADNARDDLPGAPENYELLDMDDFLPAKAAEMKPTIQRIRRST